jgi:hypothetical protein
MAQWVDRAIGRLPTISLDMKPSRYANVYILTTLRCIGGQPIQLCWHSRSKFQQHWNQAFVVTYTDCVGCQPINDYRRPVVIGNVYWQAVDSRDQGHRSRGPGIGRQPIPFTLHQSQKRLKLEYIKYSGSIPCLRHLRQLMNSTILAGQHNKSISSYALRYRQVPLYRQLIRYW